MDLPSVKDAFERVVKKQKTAYFKASEVIDKMLLEIEQTKQGMMMMDTTGAVGVDGNGLGEREGGGGGGGGGGEAPTGFESNHRTALLELNTRLSNMAPVGQISAAQKELNAALSKYGKVVDKAFCPDISKSCRDLDFDPALINQAIAQHFYREGLFELGDCFVSEANVPAADALKDQFLEMYQILEQVRHRNLQPALDWATRHREELSQKGGSCSLEFQLHQLQFIHVFQKQGQRAALDYARANFRAFGVSHFEEIKRLMGCMLFPRKLDTSPYADFLSPSLWDEVATQLTRECCNLLGQSWESPLYVTISAGSMALPTLLKLARVMANKKAEWATCKQLPVEIELEKEFQFHSIFACPVSRDQSTADNPPMLMPCGHVLCKQSINKLAKGSDRTFKCPYCPMESRSSQCREIRF
ncbi:hypothetical protein CBR_g30595 [Chara braunii]|uniref:RING-Gid-type domain-containing protein n=1 Tax=Chara braunii TaxID=69332 RepID=A0A388LD47_CHABU|nr:hypothetical protein CBR_g30595 [Chara braunii]|eukprot:GBG80229.1 hypothetical protein CBR_g30595 [Chara braunii]